MQRFASGQRAAAHHGGDVIIAGGEWDARSPWKRSSTPTDAPSRRARGLYISDNLAPQGVVEYPDHLKNAATSGTDDSLAAAIKPLLNEKPRRHASGNIVTPRMRSDAHTMLAEGEFNRFYGCAICLRALQQDPNATVEVYRAKQVENPRPESEAKMGMRVSARKLLDDLRANIGVDSALGLPAGPNSGLSVRR